MLGLKTRTCVMSRTTVSAQSWLHACPPLGYDQEHHTPTEPAAAATEPAHSVSAARTSSSRTSPSSPMTWRGTKMRPQTSLNWLHRDVGRERADGLREEGVGGAFQATLPGEDPALPVRGDALGAGEALGQPEDVGADAVPGPGAAAARPLSGSTAATDKATNGRMVPPSGWTIRVGMRPM